MTTEHKDFTTREIDEYRVAFELFDRDGNGKNIMQYCNF